MNVKRLHDQVCDFFAKMQPPMVGLSDTLTSRLRSFRGKLCTRSRCGLSATSRSREAVVPGSTAEETAYGMNDAPRKWWNRLDAAVKTMGLLPARADRCTYISYADVKKKKKKKKKTKQVAHASGDNEATQSFEQTGHPS